VCGPLPKMFAGKYVAGPRFEMTLERILHLRRNRLNNYK
jgi:hypothetical protein